jgi:hypothetical protein
MVMHASAERRHPARRAVFSALVTAAIFLEGGGARGLAAAESASPPQPAVDFDRHVQPIFSRRCLSCHGPVEPQAGLRLADREGALSELDSGRHAVVPGAPERSELLRRVASSSRSRRMPPKGEPLAAAEVEVLRRWIAAGAPWPEHWAYRPLERPEPPPAPFRATAAEADWSTNPIDRFIGARLEEVGLAPSPPAEKRSWLRRVSFGLTGLPPEPEELEAFLADEAPDAVERAVDRLLSSPRHGERWARHWMDVVHFAETHGHDQDRPRPRAWPYRDYLIRSFNADKPYARFIEEQVAGDVLFPGEPDAAIATGMLAAGPWDESSLRDIREDAIDREIGRYLDRDDIVTTVMATFNSVTIHCARCHDHKFDPISQKEYYGLQAVFAATDKAERPYDADPETVRRRRELEELSRRLPALRREAAPLLLDAALQEEVAAWEERIFSAAAQWLVLEPARIAAAEGTSFRRLDDGSWLASGARPEKDAYAIGAATELERISGLKLEVLAHDSLPHGGPGRADNGNLHLHEVHIEAAPRGAAGGEPARKLAIARAVADFDQEGWGAAKILDGDPKSGWAIHPEVGKPHWALFELAEPLESPSGFELAIRLVQPQGGGHLIGRFRLAVTGASPPLGAPAEALAAEIAAVLAVEASERTPEERAALGAFLLERRIERELAALPPQELVYAGTSRFRPDGSFRPAPGPRPVHVLERGDISRPQEAAEPGALSCVPGFAGELAVEDPADEGSRRAALARWLSAAANALTWRSIANRLWHYHFGRGLVDTPNDFGRMGSTPSHPELLDWLALELRDGGGSLKRLHRLIVTSAAYRQSARHDPLAASIDAGNRYLWRRSLERLDAESLRDAVLAAAGRLDLAMGGPSVKQFVESPGIHVTPIVDYQALAIDDPAQSRRSVYRFLFRTLPDPFMKALDCPDASQLAPVRDVTVSPLQALSLLNNRFMVRQSELLAERLGRMASDLEGRIEAAFRLVLGREARAEEAAWMKDYAQLHGLGNACRMLLNTSEFLFLD